MPTDKFSEKGFGTNFNINYVDVNNGLTQNSITAIVQDKRGFIWIGTYDGLNRFDGIELKQKRHESGNKYSLTDNRILSLFSEENGNLLVGTEGGGILIYDWKADNFRKLKLKQKQHEMSVVKSICKDKSGRIWLAGKEGVVVIDKESDASNARKSSFISFFGRTEVRQLFCDHAGNIWAGTSSGLYLINTSSLRLRVKKIREGDVATIFQDKNQIIWFGGYGNLGLVKLIGNNSIEIPSYTYLKEELFKNNKSLLISGIVQDAQGIMWLTTDNIGMVECDVNESGQFFIKERYNAEKKNENLSENKLNCAFIDQANNLWIGTSQSGAANISLNQKSIYSFLPLINSNKGKYITTLYVTEQSILIGTLYSGLLQYNTANNNLKSIQEVKSKSILCFYKSTNGTQYIGGDDGLYVLKEDGNWQKLFDGVAIRSVCEDNFNKLWLATWSGIIIYDIAANTQKYITEKNGISSNTGYVLSKQEQENTIWYGTIGGGLNKIAYDKSGIKKVKIYKYVENSNSLSNNHVWNLYADKGRLWVGTDAGLNVIEGNKVTHITHPLLRNRKITSIAKDAQDNLWLSTGHGLVKYSSKTNSAKLFTHDDGLMSNTLTEASFISESGVIYVGNINGLNAFNPSGMFQNPYLPQTAFTAIKIFDKNIEPNQGYNGRILIKNVIDATEEIKLKYDENNFTLSLAALHFASPTNNRFKYKLVGYDKDWLITEGGQTSIAYSHLPAGNYSLTVTSSNNDGVWNPKYKTLNISVAPAPWFTWWAKAIYFGLLLIGIWFLYSYYDAKRRIRKQIFVERYEKEKLIELNELKLDFFTNITHEIRTPLSLIIGPANDLIENGTPDEFISKRISIIHKNALRLYNLINQVLDLRKISGKSDSLGLNQENILNIIIGVKNSFELLAESRDISLTVNAEKVEGKVWIDKEKLEKTLYNLVSNAFNNSENNKAINISLNYTYKSEYLWAIITVEDEGRGISEEDLNHIFDMYYQSSRQPGIGSGIGLAVAKKLVEIQNGTIAVTSVIGKGATFVIEIPISDTNEQVVVPISSKNEEENIETIQEVSHIANHTGKDCILIVEDDLDLLNYITETFKEYTIIKANNAESALELAKKFTPQLIISDLVMPGMDGYSFLKEIKKDVKTNHIPVIIHSVKYEAQTIKDILKAGADDFIPKPVNYKDFKRKVRNMLQTRQKLIEAIHKTNITNPKNIVIPSADEEFLSKVFKYIEHNVSNPELSVERLSSEMAMSRMSLHRKLEAIVGKTASELIREIKMKIAGKLLASGSYRISEVMFEVGISSNHYFNKYFKDMYQMSPKEYILLHQKQKTDK